MRMTLNLGTELGPSPLIFLPLEKDLGRGRRPSLVGDKLGAILPSPEFTGDICWSNGCASGGDADERVRDCR